MVVVNLAKETMSLEIRGKYGAPCGLGETYLGWSRVGELDEMSGIYQKRPRKKGQIFVKMKYYLMPPSNTALQQSQRNKIKEAVLAWRALSFEDQVVWNKSKKPKGCSGYQYFCKCFMRS